MLELFDVIYFLLGVVLLHYGSDLLVDNADRDLRMCQECGRGMKRVFKSTGKPQFKGNGFYETDYKRKKG